MEKSWDASKKVAVQFKECFERNRCKEQSKANWFKHWSSVFSENIVSSMVSASSDQFFFSAVPLAEDKNEVLE